MNRMLLIVDPQNDFINGSLPVPGAEKAMDELAQYVTDSDGRYALRVVTADNHPADHVSFRENGGQWPRHCIAGDKGAMIWEPLRKALDATRAPVIKLHKGDTPGREEYSIFANSQAAAEIARNIADFNISEVDVCGLAGDVCVAATLRDGATLHPSVAWKVLDRYSPSIF